MSNLIGYIQIVAVGIVFAYIISTVTQFLIRAMNRNFKIINKATPEIFKNYPLASLWTFAKLFISACLFFYFCYYLGLHIVSNYG